MTQEGSSTPNLWFLYHTEGRWGWSVQLNCRIFFSWLVGWLLSLNVDSRLSTQLFEKNDLSLALQAGFLELPRSLRGFRRSLHSTWGTGVEPALLSAANVIWVGVNLWGQQTTKGQGCVCMWGKGTKSLLLFTCYLPQSTEVEAGSGIREYRQREVRPAPRELLAHPRCSASALRLQFLHSLEELPDKRNPRVSIQKNFTPSEFMNEKRAPVI